MGIYGAPTANSSTASSTSQLKIDSMTRYAKHPTSSSADFPDLQSASLTTSVCTSILRQPLDGLELTRCISPGSLTGSLTLSVAYGLNVESESNEFYSTSEGAMSALDAAMVPGAFLVDIFPTRMSSGKSFSETPQPFIFCSQIRSRVVSWS